MLSWLAPDAVRKVETVATGMPGGYDAACRLLVYIVSPFVTGVCGGTRSAVMSLDGPCPSTMPEYFCCEPKLTATLDWPSVISCTVAVCAEAKATWPTSPPTPTTGYPTSTPSDRPLSMVMVAVKFDEYSCTVCAVTTGSE